MLTSKEIWHILADLPWKPEYKEHNNAVRQCALALATKLSNKDPFFDIDGFLTTLGYPREQTKPTTTTAVLDSKDSI